MATPNIKIESLRSVDLNSLKSFRIDRIPVLPVSCTMNLVGGYYSDRTADVFFEFVEDCRKMYLAAHRCILASDSTKFHNIFYETSAGSIIKVCDTSLELFDLLLQSFYNRSVTLRIHQIEELTRLAFYYNANKCKQICIEYIKLLIEDNNIMILRCLDLALRHECVNIQALCLAKCLEYGNDLVNLPEFFTFSWQLIETVLNVDFYGRDEHQLFKMCLDQAAFECNRNHLDANNVTHVNKYLEKYLKIIRLEDLSSKNILEIINSKFVDYDDIKPYFEVHRKKADPKRRPKKLSAQNTIVSVVHIKDPMKSFHRMYGDEKTADLILTFPNCTVSLHRCILAAKGLSLAKAIFDGNLKGHCTIAFMKIVPDFFKPFYGLPIEINIDTVKAAVQFGKYFKIDEYEYMNIQPLLFDALCADTVFHIHELATYFNYYEIINKCYTLLKSSSFVWSKALKTESFYRCNPETVKFAICHGKIEASVALKTVIEWAKYQCQQQKLNSITSGATPDIDRVFPNEQIDGEDISNALSQFSDIFSDDDFKNIGKSVTMMSQFESI